MKVKNSNKPISEIQNITELLDKYSQEYNGVFIEDFGEDLGIFIFRSIGRKDFRNLVDSKAISDFAKEEVLCETCTLYPQNFDFENCDAGLPTKLSKLILEKSLLNDGAHLENAIRFCRNKINNDLDEQITCVIHEAFPEFTVEEIANWDVAKTAEYMAKSEFILHNLRGVPITPVQISHEQEVPATRKTRLEQALEDQDSENSPIKEAKKIIKEEEKPKSNNISKKVFQNNTLKQYEDQPQTQKEPEHNNKKLIPKDLSILQKLAPHIDWSKDSVSMRGMDAFMVGDVDDTPVAARGIGPEDEEYTQDILPEAMRDKFKVLGRLN